MSTGRIRSLRPEVLHDPVVATLPDEARLLLLATFSVADDAGRFPADLGFLHGQAFWGRPRPLEQVSAARDELANRGLIEVYRVAGTHYARIVGWSDDTSPLCQRIEKPKAARYPGPDDGVILGGSRKSSGRRRRRVGDASEMEGIRSEGKGEERRGEGGEATRAPVPFSDFAPDPETTSVAAELALDISAEVSACRDYHLQKGTRPRDEQASLRSWMRKSPGFARSNGARKRGRVDIGRITDDEHKEPLP